MRTFSFLYFCFLKKKKRTKSILNRYVIRYNRCKIGMQKIASLDTVNTALSFLTLSYSSECSPALAVSDIINSTFSSANHTWISLQPPSCFLWWYWFKKVLAWTTELKVSLLPLGPSSPLQTILLSDMVVCDSQLECVGHSFAYVAHLWFSRDVWIRTQSAAIASWHATDLASGHPSLYLATHPST